MKTFEQFNQSDKQISEAVYNHGPSKVDHKEVAQKIFNERTAGSALGQGVMEDIANDIARTKMNITNKGHRNKIIDKHLDAFNQDIRRIIEDILSTQRVK